MQINSIIIENWKSIDKSVESFSVRNIISRENGTGKTSTFQAIVFGLFGKVPPGFNLNTLRKNTNKPAKILVKFTYNGSQYESFRQFGGSSYVVLKKDGKTLATSSREAFSYMDKILPYNIISVLWSPDTLSSSNILKPKFLIDHLLDYVFSDPKYLLSHYKKEMFAQNKIVKNIESKLGNTENIEKEISDRRSKIESIKNNLKERSKFRDREAVMAKNAKDANDKLVEFDGFTPLDQSVISKFNSIKGNRKPEDVIEELKGRLASEESKDENIITKISPSNLRLIESESSKSGCCIICDSKWNKESSDKIIKTVENPESKDHNLIEIIKSNIEIMKNDHDYVNKSEEYYRVKREANSFPEWREVLSGYDKENNRLWDEMDKVQGEIDSLNREKETKESYTKELDKLKGIAKRVEIISSYIKEASSYYSRALTQEASSILSSISDRYDQIFLEDGHYNVSVLNQDMSYMSILPAAQLSSGEKTLVGISLILASHKLFFSHSPLLFDESFASLDLRNSEKLKLIFRNSDYQLFIITHDEFWVEGWS